jgi:hypothetical protein
VLGGLGLAQYAWGEGENFFEHTFVTPKSPQDLAGTMVLVCRSFPRQHNETRRLTRSFNCTYLLLITDFYGTEDFMEVFCIFPFVQQIMMRQAEFDDEGNISAFGLLYVHVNA